jgi:hypothetical protein
LGLGDEAGAMVNYQEAETNAYVAIERVQKIDQLVQAYKIRLLSEYMTVLISCKSLAPEEERLKKMRNFCITAAESLGELHLNPKIVSAVEQQINPPLLGIIVQSYSVASGVCTCIGLLASIIIMLTNNWHDGKNVLF